MTKLIFEHFREGLTLQTFTQGVQFGAHVVKLDGFMWLIENCLRLQDGEAPCYGSTFKQRNP